jgi:nicotinamide-nucleotide amidase
MVARGLRLAAAESLTGGRLQALITAIPGASDYFVGGVVAYNLEQKVGLLGVDREHAVAVNCVSVRVAREMALGICRLMQADFGVATTGYASAAPEHGVTVPFGQIAVWRRRSDDDGAVRFEGRFECDDSRIVVQDYIAAKALTELVNVIRREFGE